MDRYKIRIPQKYRSGFVQLAIADDNLIEQLLEVTRSSPPTLLIEDMLSEATKNYSIDDEYALEILSSILSLYSLQTNNDLSSEQIVQQVSDGLQNDLDDNSAFTDEDITKFQQRLSSFLEIRGSLEITSKAGRLLTEQENIFSGSRVITDIRPIFNSGITEGIGGALIVHALRITYTFADGTKEFFVALDSNDIKRLLQDLERALQKEESLKTLLGAVNVPYLSVNSTSNS